MPIFDLYSKRRKRAAQVGQPEIYCYEPIPVPFRIKVVHILRGAIGIPEQYGPPDLAHAWKLVHDIITREKGVFTLGEYGNYDKCCCDWFLSTANTDDALDFIEVSFRVVDKCIGPLNQWEMESQGIGLGSADAIEELNGRFREEGLGYQYENAELMRVYNQFVHAEIVKPALVHLTGKPFEKADEEFMVAHEHYRHGDLKECVVAALRACESALKAVCTVMGWTFKPGDRASDLIKLVRAKGLFPDYLGNGFDSYIAMLKTGLPEIRNNAGGHGEGPATTPVPEYIAGLALHMTAAYIVFLGEALKGTKRRGRRSASA